MEKTEREPKPRLRGIGIEWKTRALFLGFGVIVLVAADAVVDAASWSIWLRAALGFPLMTLALACFIVVVGVTRRQIPAFRRILIAMILLALGLLALVWLAD